VCKLIVSALLCYSEFFPTLMPSASSPGRWKVIVAFALVYVFWGSTYLAIGIAVEHIPPALMCATRFTNRRRCHARLVRAYGRRVRHRLAIFSHGGCRRSCSLMGGNLTLSYAERIVPTGLSALLIAITPLWFLVLDSLILGDHHISQRGKIGLLLGIAGIGVLIWPELTTPASIGRRELWWSIALLAGSFTWALGSVLSKSGKTPILSARRPGRWSSQDSLTSFLP